MRIFDLFLFGLLLTWCGIIESPNSAYAASFLKAEMYSRYGLNSDAKRELIDLISDIKTSPQDNAKAFYLLGSISFSENNIKLALDTWKQLINKYPQSSEAALVKDNISELSEIIGKQAEEDINNIVAEQYIKNGDFWSNEKNEIFSIDTSWLDHIESACKWYDKVIAEFPKSAASQKAYEEKMRTILGWKEPGQYGEVVGIRSDFKKYIPLLIDVFRKYESDFPDATRLQSFRFQIAQAYWRNNQNSEECKKWLQEIIDKCGDSDSFYKDLAQRRLLKPR